jgi:hypothetical protein
MRGQNRQTRGLPQEELNIALLNSLLGLNGVELSGSDVHCRLSRGEESRLTVEFHAEQATDAEHCAERNARVVRVALREFLVELREVQLASRDAVVDAAKFDIVLTCHG